MKVFLLRIAKKPGNYPAIDHSRDNDGKHIVLLWLSSSFGILLINGFDADITHKVSYMLV